MEKEKKIMERASKHTMVVVNHHTWAVDSLRTFRALEHLEKVGMTKCRI